MIALSPELPTGTVTFLFTDIEGSTKLLRELGDDYGPVQNDHMRLLRAAIAEGGGTELRTEGDAFFAVFPSAPGAVRAAVAAQRSLDSHPWSHGRPLRVRMGMHTGEGRPGGDDYLGIDVNRAARIAAAGHGGQVLLSDATRSLVEHDLPQGVSLRDLGRHRLKDFDDPLPIHDLFIEGLPSEFPPLKTLETPTNLPAELTSFVGREGEVDGVAEHLAHHRLVTLTGPGGTGKTRLAIQASRRLLHSFPDGVFFVELASITDPELVPSAIASTLGMREQGPRSVMETLVIELLPRAPLLVLDNFEQVMDAAGAVAGLLSAVPHVRFLVTSRGPLRIQGEQEVPVPPLEVPPPDGAAAPGAVTAHPAVALFVERARMVDPGFSVSDQNAATVAEICRRLDGLPLAIELAASRLRLFSPRAMLERLDRVLPLLTAGSRDLPARQRTLRGAIAWSYDLLEPGVAALFRRMCVFAGGFSLAALEAVCDPQGQLEVDTFQALEALLDANLVRRRGDAPDPRFETLQTVREFGLEHLEQEGEAEDVRARHARFFLGVAEESAPQLRGPQILERLDVLRLEHDNLRAALRWAIAEDRGDEALRLASALWRFWHLHGHLTDGRRWVDQALSLPSAQERSQRRAWALIAAGSLAYWQLDEPAIETAYREALAIFRDHDDAQGIAHATYNLGFVPMLEGRAEEADQLFTTSRALFEELGDLRGVADAEFGLGIVCRLRKEFDAARAHAERALEAHERLGDFFGEHGDLYLVGRSTGEMGDGERARRFFLRTLGIAQGMADGTGLALSLDNLADLEITGGNALRAMRLAGMSEAIKERTGGQAPPELIDLPDPRERAAALLSEEEIRTAWEEGRAMSLEEALVYARSQD